VTDIWSSQIGAEAWVAANPPQLVSTQFGAEAWVAANPPLIVVTQIGVEVWAEKTPGTTEIVTTQLGAEVWCRYRPPALVPVGLAVEDNIAFPMTVHQGAQLLIEEFDIIYCEPIALPASIIPTPQAVELAAGFNWTPLTDIAGSVTDAEREKLAGQGTKARVESAVIEERQLPVRTYRLPSLYRYPVDAFARALQIQRWLEGRLKGFYVIINRYRNQVEMGQVARIVTYPKYGLQNGFTGTVVRWREIPAKGQVHLVLIGTTPD